MGEALAQGTQATSEAAAPPDAPAAAPPNTPAATPPNTPAATPPNTPAATPPDPLGGDQAEQNSALGLDAPAAPAEGGSDATDTEPAGAEVTPPLAAEDPQYSDTATSEPVANNTAASAAVATAAESAPDDDNFDFSDLEAEASNDFVSGPKLDIYGFADFTYQHWIQNIEPGYKPSFAVGNFNVYLATEFGSNWRSLAEVRFLYLPHGALPANEIAGSPINTTVPDHADIQRPLRWGGVEIERVWLEYAFDQLLTVRGGQWLTPYGIWNVDHGSPTIIATYRPYIVGEALFPERQTGLHVHGSGYLGPVKLGYHLTLSNGRGPIDAYADLDANKAVGGRLFVENTSSLGNITFGVSTYVGRYTNSEFSVGASGFTSVVLERFDEFGYAADLKWLYEGLHLQSEVVVHEVRYDDELRPNDLYGRPGLIPDFRRWGGYALLGYRTPFWGIMPYVNVEYYDSGPTGFFGKIPAYWFGVNVRPIPSIVLKAQVLYADSAGMPGVGDVPPFSFLTTQAAWSF